LEPGGFEGPSGGGAGLVVEQGHLAKDIAGDKVTEGGIPLAADADGDLNAALKDAKSLAPLVAFVKKGFSLGQGFFAHVTEG
jgi:hypothetical protein